MRVARRRCRWGRSGSRAGRRAGGRAGRPTHVELDNRAPVVVIRPRGTDAGYAVFPLLVKANGV
eukprot:3591458-Pyramimonas_sp.AAC.1